MKIFSNLKKGILIPAAIILIASAGAGSTAAYFRHAQTVKNVLSVGESTIEIAEDYAPPKEMQQGENIYKKKVAVKIQEPSRVTSASMPGSPIRP